MLFHIFERNGNSLLLIILQKNELQHFQFSCI
uniref:Uncharacterized protein n=1 Tax=Arundo donax TaxID=35708 RepID=A0A0A9ASD8_ARUDO